MPSSKILLVINKKSGSSDEEDYVNILKNLPGVEQQQIDHYYLSGESDKQNVLSKIGSFRPEIVIAVGGDGTVNFVASLVLNSSYILGIIPAGSANGLAAELNIPQTPEEAFKLILNGEPSFMDVVQINNDRISLHLSDAGINARIVREFEKEGKRGFAGYIKHFFRELIRPQRSFLCSIETETGNYVHRSLMTIIANASSYRTGANMNPLGKIDDGKFEIIVFKPYRRWIWMSLLGAFTRSIHRQPNVETYQCTSASLTIKPPQQLQVDGESLGLASQFSGRIMKHALKIILP